MHNVTRVRKTLRNSNAGPSTTPLLKSPSANPPLKQSAGGLGHVLDVFVVLGTGPTVPRRRSSAEG